MNFTSGRDATILVNGEAFFDVRPAVKTLPTNVRLEFTFVPSQFMLDVASFGLEGLLKLRPFSTRNQYADHWKAKRGGR